MLTKEKLRNLLSSECVNCSCRINRRKEKVNHVSTHGTTITGNQSIAEALSFIFKISLKNLVTNIQSYFTNMLDDPLEQSDELIQIVANNFVFCGKCNLLFQEVHSAHKTFYECSAVDNLFSKAIQNKHQNIEDTIIQPEYEDNISTTDDIISEIKSDNDGDEINSLSGQEKTWNNDDNESQNSSIRFTPEQIKIDLDQTEIEESKNNPDPLLDLEYHDNTIRKAKPTVVSKNIVSDLIEYPEDDTIFNGPPFLCPICNDSYIVANELRLHCKYIHRILLPCNSSLSGLSNENEATKITDDLISKVFITYNYSEIEGPPFHCPMCNQPCRSQNGLTRHCRTLHQLLIPEGKILQRYLKSGVSTTHDSVTSKVTTFNCEKCHFTTSDSLSKGATFQCPKCCQFTTHDSVINGPPFQCPKCDKSFLNRKCLTTHCKFRHLLLLPVPTSDKPKKSRKSKLRNIICSKCKYICKNIVGWKAHCRLLHGCYFYCNLCISCFATNDDLVEHLKTSCESIRCNSNDDFNNDCHKSNETENEGKSPNDVEMSQPKSSKDLTIQLDLSRLNNHNNIVNRPGNVMTNKPSPAKHKLTTRQECDFTLKMKKKRPRIGYHCNECDENFIPEEDFKQHLKTAHFEKYVSCVRTSSPADANSDRVFDISSLNCTECDLTFQHYDLLKKHSFEIHSITLENYEQRFYNYICRKCDKLFETVYALSLHLGKCCDESVKMFDCKFCTTRFNSSEKLSVHMKFLHDINIPIVSSGQKKNNYRRCSVCLKVFDSCRDLSYHKILSGDIMKNASTTQENSSGPNKNAEIICQICHIRFGTLSGLKSHQWGAHQVKVVNSLKDDFNCDTCNKSFSSNDTLENHTKRVHFKKKEKCKVCHKELDVSQMSRHMKSSHIGYKPHKCTFCNKRFLYTKELNCHIACVHTGARPFVCSICGKGFSMRMKMKYHEQTHSTRKLFVCERCGSSLKSKRTYNGHMKKHKEDDLAGPNPKCPECNEVFSSGPKLRHHKLIKHNKHGPVPCPICGKIFAFKQRVTDHMKAMHRERYFRH